MAIYTVVGIYTDTFQRFCDEVKAESPEDAERYFTDLQGSELLVAGVFEGSIEAVA